MHVVHAVVVAVLVDEVHVFAVADVSDLVVISLLLLLNLLWLWLLLLVLLLLLLLIFMGVTDVLGVVVFTDVVGVMVVF